jgi:hypothetical protein
MRQGEIGARRERVAEDSDDPGRVLSLGQEVRDRDQQQRDRLPEVSSTCSTVPTENARFAIMAPSAAPTESCTRRPVIASATTAWTSCNVLARTVALPTLTLYLLTRQRYRANPVGPSHPPPMTCERQTSERARCQPEATALGVVNLRQVQLTRADAS